MWDLSYPTGDRTCGPALKGRFLTTETTREVPPLILRLRLCVLCSFRIRLPGFPTGRSCELSIISLINSFSTEEPDWCQLVSRRNEIKQSLSLVAQKVKHLPAVWEIPGLGMATHSSTLAWRISWTEEPGRPQSMGLQRVRHDWATSLSLFFS